MKETVLIISGWAHGIEHIRPMGQALADRFDVKLLTGSEVLEARHIPDADFIVTGSMGGLLAMELLPESCQKLVLISSTAKFCSDAGYPCGTPERVLKRMILQLKRNPEAVLADFYRNVHHPHAHTCASVGEPLGSLVSGLDYLLAADVRAKIATIGIPVLLLHGARDRIIPPGAAEWLHNHLPDNELKVFDDDGHALPAHHFAEIIREAKQFLLETPYDE
jgi:pimeloyl-[acyl-carrier protein] methyl ester esterase